MVKVCDICGKEIIRGTTADVIEQQEYKDKRLRVALVKFYADGTRENYRDVCKECSVKIDSLLQVIMKKGDAK